MNQKMKIPPHLFIGLGGCGSKIVNEIARKLKRRGDEYARYKELIHFFAFDTDQHELKQATSVDVRVPISNFEKRAFVAHAFGDRGAPEDSLLTAWWPEYYMPRDVAGAGAGQIRIESRLATYFTLRFRPEVMTALEHAVGQSFSIDARFRDQEKSPMVHIYASLAGGTGSGAFMPLAYLLYDLFREHRRPQVVGTFVLPAVFRRAGLPTQQLDKIMANGYAALMELEYMQAATDSDPVEFQYDPRVKERQVVKRRAFDQVYMIDDIGAGREVITDTREIFQALADGAYSQIFSDLLGRQASTADNDEREMGVADHQLYTKRYGCFGLSVLTVPDVDILEYCAQRFAVEALGNTFALPKEAIAENESRADRERRDQDFVRSLLQSAHTPGEAGAFYKRIVEACDGAPQVQGVTDRFLRYFDTAFGPRLQQHLGALPRWNEDKLLEYDEDPEAVRIEMPKRLEAWKTFVGGARERIDQEAGFIASEVSGDAHEYSFAKLLGDHGPIFERLFLIRVSAALRERQAHARAAEAAAQQTLTNLDQSYSRWVVQLTDAAPKTMVEYVRGNDYRQEIVPEFMAWYRNNMETPQVTLLQASGMVDLCDDILRQVDERKDRLGTLFAELTNIRAQLDAGAEELRTHGVRRDDGGLSNEHVLDVEVYQNLESPEPFRMWHWVFDRRENPAADYDPGKVFPAVQKAYGNVQHARHMSAAVRDALVGIGRQIWRERIAGRDEPKGLDEMGLEVSSGLEEEARLALAWAKLRKHHGDAAKHHYRAHKNDWERALESLSQDDIDEYLRQKIHFAARKCAPFLRLVREERATGIEPKRYVVVLRHYLEDKRIRAALLENASFPVKPADALVSDNPKAIVFYWSELGMPLYRIESMDEYYDRYHYVKRDELSRGKVYRGQDLPYHPKSGGAAPHAEGRKVPDIPLHIDKRWEGAPDELECLPDIAPRAVFADQGRKAWLERRERVHTARAAEELVQFVWAQVFELLVKKPDADFAFSNEDIPERDRKLGKFRDAAFDRFRDAKLAIREWLIQHIDARCKRFVDERDREGLKTLVGTHVEELKKLRLQLEGKEQAFVERELAAANQALETLLAKM